MSNSRASANDSQGEKEKERASTEFDACWVSRPKPLYELYVTHTLVLEWTEFNFQNVEFSVTAAYFQSNGGRSES